MVCFGVVANLILYIALRTFALQILFSIHAAGRSFLGEEYANFVSVVQRTQLLQCLKMLDWRRSKLRVGAQETRTVRIDADMAQDRHI